MNGFHSHLRTPRTIFFLYHAKQKVQEGAHHGLRPFMGHAFPCAVKPWTTAAPTSESAPMSSAVLSAAAAAWAAASLTEILIFSTIVDQKHNDFFPEYCFSIIYIPPTPTFWFSCHTNARHTFIFHVHNSFAFFLPLFSAEIFMLWRFFPLFGDQKNTKNAFLYSRSSCLQPAYHILPVSHLKCFELFVNFSNIIRSYFFRFWENLARVSHYKKPWMQNSLVSIRNLSFCKRCEEELL